MHNLSSHFFWCLVLDRLGAGWNLLESQIALEALSNTLVPLRTSLAFLEPLRNPRTIRRDAGPICGT